jgi:hypothetical protein
MSERAEIDHLNAEVKRLRNDRLIMAIFGAPSEGPLPFALLGDDDKPFALGVQWPGGAVTVKSTPPERLGNVTSASLDDFFTQYGQSAVVWLSEDLGTLADMEERAMRAEAWLDELGAAAGYGSIADVAAHQRSLGVEGDHETRLQEQRVAKLKAAVLEEAEWRRQVLHEWQERAEVAEAERDRLRAAVDAALAIWHTHREATALNQHCVCLGCDMGRALTTEEDQ